MRIAAATVVGLAALAMGAGSAPSTAASKHTVLDVGDSLSIGAGPYLRTRLQEYRFAQAYDVGLHAYDAARIVSARRVLPSVLIVSAGTNDDPRIVSTFVHSVSAIVEAAGDDRCVVWPTIVRPEAVGATYSGLNQALRRTATHHDNLVLVDWVGLVRNHPWWLAEDGVHVSSAGYRARARAIATAVRSGCS
jgi:lysophospholipase L1-like esterase